MQRSNCRVSVTSQSNLLETAVRKTRTENSRESMAARNSGGSGVAGRWRRHFLRGEQARLFNSVGTNGDNKSGELRCPEQEALVTCCLIRWLEWVEARDVQMCGDHCFRKCSVSNGTPEIRMPDTTWSSYWQENVLTVWPAGRSRFQSGESREGGYSSRKHSCDVISWQISWFKVVFKIA